MLYRDGKEGNRSESVASTEKFLQDKKGNRWNFHYWYGGALAPAHQQAQRLFFWNDDNSVEGVVLYPPNKTVPYTRIKDMMAKLAANESLRKQYSRPLLFPLGKHYSTYPVFPEETEAASAGLSSTT
jgi:hypothetical protein